MDACARERWRSGKVRNQKRRDEGEDERLSS
jgi:hypothetical protein